MGSKPKSASAKKTTPSASGTESPWKKRLTVAAGAAVVAVIVGAVAFSSDPLRGVPEGTEELDVGAGEHVEGELHAEGEVPAGGAHSAAWLNCGIYDTEVPSENAVHSLEHGAVWITYRPEIGDEAIDRLRRFYRAGDKVIVSPEPSQVPPIMATAWANQLELDTADDARLSQFVAEFKASTGAPEPGGRCDGGVGTPVG